MLALANSRIGWCPLEKAAKAGATDLLLAMLRESASAHGAAPGRRLPPREQRTAGDGSALRVLATVAKHAGNADTAAVLEWLEGLESPENAQLDFAEENKEKRSNFKCPVCSTTDNAVALGPCGHQVCGNCWSRCSDSCPMCRKRPWHAVKPESWPSKAKLFARFCVQL